MTLPTLSVLLSNYNHARYLTGCLDAILQQSAQPLEIIVIDDGSTDGSVALLEDYARRHRVIKFYRNEENRGVLFTVNRSIDLARGDYVYPAAADDQILPGFFEKSLRLLSEHPQAALSCTIGDWRESATGYRWLMGAEMAERPCYLSPARMLELERKGKLYLASHTALIKRNILMESGKFLPELKWYCDWYFQYVAGFRYGVCVVPEPLAVFNIHPKSYYASGHAQKLQHREVLAHLLKLLNRPENREPAELIRQSGALFLFELPILRLMLTRAEYRRFITPVFLRKNLWHALKLRLKRITPAFVAHWYFQTFYGSRKVNRPKRG
jgi:glycosyltransferase involved in cell wall biosynthesis